VAIAEGGAAVRLVESPADIEDHDVVAIAEHGVELDGGDEEVHVSILPRTPRPSGDVTDRRTVRLGPARGYRRIVTDARPRIHSDITSAFGGTPLVRLNRLTEGLDATVLVKLEYYNPGRSVKDRLAVSLVDAAEASGELQPGGTIVESTSGNTGIGLALVGAARGYRVILTMPASMSKERRAMLKAYGAELVLTDPHKGMTEAVEQAQRIAAETPGAVLVRQFENPANPAIHRRTTAVEIWDDTDGAVDVFVAGSGTGGTLTGVGQVLKERKPSVRVVAVQPKDSPMLTEGRAGGHRIQGIGPNFVPAVIDRAVIDEVVDAEFEDAIRVARDLATREGILAGMSAGAAVWAALEVAKRPESAGATIVVIIPDSGERYLTTPLFVDPEPAPER